MPTRTGKGRWEGTLKEGKGTVSFGDGAFEGAYSFGSRFESGKGTNPEELLAAAHAACFSMAFSGELTTAGHVPDYVESVAHVTVEKDGGGFAITKSHIVSKARVPGIDQDAFQKAAENAKKGCPVSKSLAGVEITLDAKLVS